MLLRNISSSLDRCFDGLSLFVLFNLFLVDFAERSNADSSSWHCQLEIPSTTIVKIFKNKCYHFISDEKYWTNARLTCAEYGANLVKNENEETNDFLASALNGITEWKNNGVWIGLHDRNQEGRWEWETGKDDVHELVSWTNWARGHPRSWFRSHNDCVYMSRSGGKWSWVDAPCETLRWRYRFICEYEPFALVTADPEDYYDRAEASLVFFAIFGVVAVLVCVAGTAGGLIFYKIFYGKRGTPLSRNRLQRSETNPSRSPLNMYVDLDKVTGQRRSEDIARGSDVDNDVSSGIYEEVSAHPTTVVLDVTYENQSISEGYVPMIRQRSNTEITRSEERENPCIMKPDASSDGGPSCVRDLTPSLSSSNCEHDATENKYEEIEALCVVQAQAPRKPCANAYYNVSINRNVPCDGGNGRNTYERMDRVIAA